MKTEKTYLLLGSNLGNSVAVLKSAVQYIDDEQNISLKRISPLYKTEPWGVKNQNWFINAVVEIETCLQPAQLLEKCQKIEQILGRNRANETRWGERTIDIDIIFYGNNVVKSENLTIPHCLMHKRAFVLVPLMDLAADFVHPVFQKTVKRLYDELEEKEKVLLFERALS